MKQEENGRKYIGTLVIISDTVEYDDIRKIIYFETSTQAKKYIKNYVKNYNNGRKYYKMTYDYYYQYSSRFDKIKLEYIYKNGTII